MLALYFLVAMGLFHAENASDGEWVFKLTSVNYMIVTVYILYAAISVSYQYWMSCRYRPSEEKTTSKSQAYKVNTEDGTDISCSLKVHWFLHNLAANHCTFITLAFWVMLAPSRKGGFPPSMRTYLVIDRHGINLLLLIIDFLVNKIPFRVLHCVYPSIFIGLYFIYNAIYWAITQKLVYGEILNYETRAGKIAGMVLGAVIFAVPIIQMIWFLAFILKKKLTKNHQTDLNENCEMKTTADSHGQVS